MKKWMLILLAAVCSTSLFADKKSVCTFAQLPADAQSFITSYYAADQVALVMMEKDLTSTEYEVSLHNGVSIDFKGDGSLDKIEANSTLLPEGIVPSTVANYIASQFPTARVVEYDPSTLRQEVKLDNGMELVFNAQGQFIGIDD